MASKRKKQREVLNHRDLRAFKIARGLCLIFIVIFIIFLLFMMSSRQISYIQMIQQYPILTAGFIVCLLNFFIWWQTKPLLQDLEETKHIDYYRIVLSLYVFVQFLLFNYPSAALFAYGLYKNFKWKGYPFHLSYKNMKKDGMTTKLYVNIFVLAFGILFTLWFIAAFS